MNIENHQLDLICPKVPHIGTGYLHHEKDDGPYDVDGVLYCGHCHYVCDRNGNCELNSSSEIARQKPTHVIVVERNK